MIKNSKKQNDKKNAPKGKGKVQDGEMAKPYFAFLSYYPLLKCCSWGIHLALSLFLHDHIVISQSAKQNSIRLMNVGAPVACRRQVGSLADKNDHHCLDEKSYG